MIGEIENKLKTIISDSLQEYFGTSWLVKGLPKNTYTKAKKLADEKAYDLQLNSGDDAEDVNVWDFVSLADYVSIVTNGKNWSYSIVILTILYYLRVADLDGDYVPIPT